MRFCILRLICKLKTVPRRNSSYFTYFSPTYRITRMVHYMYVLKLLGALAELRLIINNIGFPRGGYKGILSHRVPIYPCIRRKSEIQYYNYLDHPGPGPVSVTCEIMNFLYEQKVKSQNLFKMMALEVELTFQRFWSKHKPQSFTTAILEAH